MPIAEVIGSISVCDKVFAHSTIIALQGDAIRAAGQPAMAVWRFLVDCGVATPAVAGIVYLRADRVPGLAALGGERGIAGHDPDLGGAGV